MTFWASSALASTFSTCGGFVLGEGVVSLLPTGNTGCKPLKSEHYFPVAHNTREHGITQSEGRKRAFLFPLKAGAQDMALDTASPWKQRPLRCGLETQRCPGLAAEEAAAPLTTWAVRNVKKKASPRPPDTWTSSRQVFGTGLVVELSQLQEEV